MLHCFVVYDDDATSFWVMQDPFVIYSHTNIVDSVSKAACEIISMLRLDLVFVKISSFIFLFRIVCSLLSLIYCNNIDMRTQPQVLLYRLSIIFRFSRYL